MAAKSKWGTKLRKLKQGWQGSEQAYKEMFGASEIPEDVYVMKLQEACLDETNAGKLRIKREHIIMEGDHKGVAVRDGMNLETDMGLVFVRRWFAMMDVDVPDDIEELETVLSEIKDAAPIIKGRIRHYGDFTNVDVLSIFEDGEDAGDGAGEEGEEEIDLDSMDKAELRMLVKDKDLEIDGWRKMDEDTLRAAIAEVIGEEGGEEEGGEEEGGEEEGGEEEVDLDSLDKAGLLALIEENEIDAKDLGFKNKLVMKKASEDKIRAALQEALAGEGEEEGGEGEGDEDELLEQAKVFCGTWDVDIAEDADLDDIKAAIAECKFPEKELDEDEVELLNSLELSDAIQKAKPKETVKKTVKKTGKK